jgi:hypothetical protein
MIIPYDSPHHERQEFSEVNALTNSDTRFADII